VEEQFAADPELDVLLADNLIVDPRGEYLAHRFSLIPTLGQMWARFSVASCALFFRRRVWEPFDIQWKSAGDWWWFRAMVERGARIGILRKFVAAFTETQANLGLAPVTAPEHARILAARPWWARGVFKHLLLARHRWRMWQSGAFAVKPFTYALYTHGDIDGATRSQHGLSSSAVPATLAASASLEENASFRPKRREFSVPRPTARWIRRW
jgi:hypothetical protein